MKENANPRTRLLILVEILTMYSDENNILSLEEICGYLRDYGFDVSKRSVTEDIKAVNTTPIKIISVSKPKKGYYLVKHFSQDAIRFILEAIFSSVILSEEETEYIKKYLRRNACLPTLDLILDTTVNLNSFAPKRTVSSEVLNTLRMVIKDQKQAILTVSCPIPGDTFSDARRFETVTVNPITLAVADGKVSLIFSCEDSPCQNRFINTIRINKVEILDSKSTVNTDDPVSATNYFDGSPPEISYYFRDWLMIRFKSEYIELVENHFNSPVQFRKDEITGYCDAKVLTIFDDNLLGWLLALADKIEVIAPQNVKKLFDRQAQNILNRQKR